MAQQTELRLNEHYYTKTAANNQFALKKYHYHDGQDGNADYRNYSLLISTDASTNTTTNVSSLVAFSSNKIYAHVTCDGNEIRSTNEEKKYVAFIINGRSYVKEINTVVNNHYFAAVNMNINIVKTYPVYASYIGNNSNGTTVSHSYCSDYHLVDVLPEYVLTSNDLFKEHGTATPFSVTLKDRQGGNNIPNQKIVFIVNGQWYERDIAASGTASLNINLPAGTYPIETKYFYTVNNEQREVNARNTIFIYTK